MGSHVPPIREQRHRPVDDTRDDLDRHHGGGQSNDPPYASFSGGLHVSPEGVLVLPHVDSVVMHAAFLIRSLA